MDLKPTNDIDNVSYGNTYNIIRGGAISSIKQMLDILIHLAVINLKLETNIDIEGNLWLFSNYFSQSVGKQLGRILVQK